MDDFAVRVDNLNKSFRLPHEKQGSIKSALINFGKRGYEVQHVLNDISFEIKKGEFFGIVGRNGSGKSTLLKLLAGIYKPDSGEVHIRGSLTPFIELGVGFNPELTGRENIYLNGALLGFNRAEMEAMYGDIVSFAELERFMDQKLKNYSSGMQVRLAFSIAIRAQTDILLLDEVLAVGDEAFQRKCYEYFEDLKRNKKTVILVTHDMGAVERFCDRAMFIEDGNIRLNGDPKIVGQAYSKSNEINYDTSQLKAISGQLLAEQNFARKSTSHIQIDLQDDREKTAVKFRRDQLMKVRCTWNEKGVNNLGVAIFTKEDEYVYGTNTFIEGVKITKPNTATFKVKLNLIPGEYYVKVGLFGNSDKVILDMENYGPGFRVIKKKDDIDWEGITKLVSAWEP